MKIVILSDGAPHVELNSNQLLSQFVELMPNEYTIFSIVFGDGFRYSELEQSISDYIFFTTQPNMKCADFFSQKLPSIGHIFSKIQRVGHVTLKAQRVIDAIRPELVLFSFRSLGPVNIVMGLETYNAIRFFLVEETLTRNCRENLKDEKHPKRIFEKMTKLSKTVNRVFVTSELDKDFLGQCLAIKRETPISVIDMPISESSKAKVISVLNFHAPVVQTINISPSRKVPIQKPARISDALWLDSGPTLTVHANESRAPKSIFIWNRFSFRLNHSMLFPPLPALTESLKKILITNYLFSKIMFSIRLAINACVRFLFAGLEKSAARTELKNRKKLGVGSFVPGALSQRDQDIILARQINTHDQFIESIGQNWVN